MSYVTPITDRTQSDIIAQNSKAFWNVVDFVRVYGNSLETSTALENAIGAGIAFDALSSPTTTNIPTVSDFNTFLANIERMRYALKDAILDTDFTEIKDDYIAGQRETAPDYLNANQWEKVIDIIYQIYKATYAAEGTPICGVAVCGASDLGV